MNLFDYATVALLMWLFGFGFAWALWTLIINDWPDGERWSRPRAWAFGIWAAFPLIAAAWIAWLMRPQA